MFIEYENYLHTFFERFVIENRRLPFNKHLETCLLLLCNFSNEYLTALLAAFSFRSAILLTIILSAKL